MKFDTENNSFVHVMTRRGAIMMITAVRDGAIPRYDLQGGDGGTLANIGEYELTAATEAEIRAALSKAEPTA